MCGVEGFPNRKKKSPASAVPSVLQITLAFFSSVFWFPAGLFPVAQGMLACVAF